MRTIAEIEVTPAGSLWIDVLTDPPGLAIRRQDAGLVHVEVGEIGDLMKALALAAMELAELDTGPRFTLGYLSAIGRTREELAKGQLISNTLDWLEGVARRSAKQRGLILPAEFDESPIADPNDPDQAAGNPDDFYDGGEQHSDVW